MKPKLQIATTRFELETYPGSWSINWFGFNWRGRWHEWYRDLDGCWTKQEPHVPVSLTDHREKQVVLQQEARWAAEEKEREQLGWYEQLLPA